MKKISLLGMSACIALSLGSCDKQQPQPAQQKAVLNNLHANARNYVDGGDKPDSHWDGKGCSGKPKDCLPPVVVTATTITAVRDVMSTNDPKMVGNFFSSSAGVAAADEMHISDANLAKLASGTYGLTEKVSESQTDMTYLLAGQGAAVSMTSPEFVLQVNVK